MQDRELKTVQQDRLFEIQFAMALVEGGMIEELRDHLGTGLEAAMNGMSADEIEAVRSRVDRAVDRKKKKLGMM